MVNRIVTEVHGDEDGRSTWMDRQATYYRRRYAREFRNVDWPWPGANDIVMPTIDLTIDKLKAVLARVIFTRPMVTFKATNPDSHSRTQTAEIFYDWLINEGMPDFKNQLLVMLDSVLQHGYGMVKVFWDYRTRNVTRVLNRSDLPREFRDLVPDVEQRLANSPIPVNTGILTEQLKARIKEDFQTNARKGKGSSRKSTGSTRKSRKTRKRSKGSSDSSVTVKSESSTRRVKSSPTTQGQSRSTRKTSSSQEQRSRSRTQLELPIKSSSPNLPSAVEQKIKAGPRKPLISCWTQGDQKLTIESDHSHAPRSIVIETSGKGSMSSTRLI